MTCRHVGNDPDCSSNKSKYEYEEKMKKPDSEKYSIESAVEIGKNLVLKILYPNCASCAYEGNKILVYLNTNALAALKWRKVDPHFRDPGKGMWSKGEAPPPAARFPASTAGWDDALAYARSKT